MNMTKEAPTTQAINIILRKLYRKGRKVHSGDLKAVLPPSLQSKLTFAIWGLRNMGRIKSLGRPRGYQFISIAFALLLVSTVLAVAQQSPQTVVRDAGGRTIGTATTDSQGTTVFRNSQGSTTGTASRDSQGTTTFRNDRGTVTGTSQSPFLERR